MATEVVKVEVPVVDALTKLRARAEVDGVVYVQLLQAALTLEMHPQYVGKLCVAGTIESVRDGREPRGRIWVSEDAIAAYIAGAADRKANRGTGIGGAAYRALPSAARHIRWVSNRLADAMKNGDLTTDSPLSAVLSHLSALDADAVAKKAVKDAEKAAKAAEAEADEDFNEATE